MATFKLFFFFFAIMRVMDTIFLQKFYNKIYVIVFFFKSCDKLLMVDKGTIFSQKFHYKIYVTIFF